MTNLGAGSPAPFFWRLSTGNEANKLEPLLFRGGVARLTNLFVSRSGVVFRGARGAPHHPIRLKARLRRTKSHCPSSEEEGLGQRQFLPPNPPSPLPPLPSPPPSPPLSPSLFRPFFLSLFFVSSPPPSPPLAPSPPPSSLLFSSSPSPLSLLPPPPLFL